MRAISSAFTAYVYRIRSRHRIRSPHTFTAYAPQTTTAIITRATAAIIWGDQRIFNRQNKTKTRRRVLNAPPRLNIKIFALPSSLWLLPWSLLDPPCQIYGGLLD
jgi:hypothetical protein